MTLSAFPPGVYLVGALRSGSTYLASLLDRHPKICVSRPKEPGYFTVRQDMGIEWYRERFTGSDDSILIDATAWYTAAPTKAFPHTHGKRDAPYIDVPERIHSISPSAKFIYIVREPVSRIHSLYWFLYRNFQENKDFGKAIREDPLYLRTSDYYGQIENYLNYFTLSSIKVITFENLIARPQDVVNECFGFLGLSDLDIDTTFEWHQKNASYQYRSLYRKLGMLTGGAEMLERGYRGAKKLAPVFMHGIIEYLLFREKSPMKRDDIRYIEEKLKPCNLKLAESLDIVYQQYDK